MFEDCAGEGQIDEDDEAFARRLQDAADREHYARLIELTGSGGSLEAAFREGGEPQLLILLLLVQCRQEMQEVQSISPDWRPVLQSAQMFPNRICMAQAGNLGLGCLEHDHCTELPCVLA
jgi:hypothetical protein